MSVMCRRAMCAAIALLGTGLAEQASATIYTITYTGVVNNTATDSKGNSTPATNEYATASGGVDLLGLFSPAGTSLAGLAVVTQYVVDSAGGEGELYGADISSVVGGSIRSSQTASPVLSISMTINGVTLDLVSNTYGSDSRIVGYQGFNGVETQAYVNTNPSGPGDVWYYFQNSVFSDRAFTRSALEDSASYSPPIADTTDGFLYIGGAISGTGFGEFIGSNVTKVEVRSLGSVPEPSSWGLMVIGLGAIGTALRRRRAKISGI